MARVERRRAQNAPGLFFVDVTCIDCGTCRWMAPDTFAQRGGKSAVVHQPENRAAQAAFRALVSCPVGAIGAPGTAAVVEEVAASFPVPVEDNVYHCGFHSPLSHGAASWFIRRDRGNYLVDSPRFTEPLVSRLRDLGGVACMFLTHRDDVADHRRFRQELGCERILHADDVTRDTHDVERKLSSNEPVPLDDDLLVIPVPGHTRGHTALLYAGRFLFSGDHVTYSSTSGHLRAFRQLCWYSWAAQIESQKRLLDYAFEWVLPAHGEPLHLPPAEMRTQIERCIGWMQRVS